MTDSVTWPSWGVLARTDMSTLRRAVLEVFPSAEAERFRFEDEQPWSVVFDMRPGPTDETDVAEALRVRGVEAVQLDFHPDRHATRRWDGRSWGILDLDENPIAVLERLRLSLPGRAPSDKPRRVQRRAACVVVGLTYDEVREYLPEGRQVRAEEGPVGVILHAPGSHTVLGIAEHTGARVYDVHFRRDTGEFEVHVLEGERSLGTFDPAVTEPPQVPNPPPFVADILGETTPAAIITRLGLDASFLE